MSDKFRLHIKADPVVLVIEQLVELRADVDALTVLTIETLAKSTGEGQVEIAERHQKLREEFMLKRCFDLENSGPDE